MVVSCPACTTRYRLSPERYSGKRITLKCPRCEERFRVSVAPDAAPMPIQVLVAHSDPALCQTAENILTRGGFGCRICHEGNEALQILQADTPWAALIDVALPGLYAFEVVEKVRALPGLDQVKIILLSSVYNKAAYKRTPASLYGADAYLEKHHLPDLLVPKIRQLLSAGPVSSGGSESGEEAAIQGADPEPDDPQRFVAEMSSQIRNAEQRQTGPGGSAQGTERARRLARIIVSDIALYNQERVEQGIRSGTFFELLKEEIAEGRRLFAERIDPAVCGREDYLQEAFEAFLARRRQEIGV